MAYVIEIPNALEPHKAIKHVIDTPTTIWDWVRHRHPGVGEFPNPTVIAVNGQYRLRKDWDYVLQEKDICSVVTVPAGIETALIIAIVAVVITLSITLVFMLNAPKAPGEQPKSDPVFTDKGQQNEIRLGEPIECSYGRNRIYPSYAARPYYEYRDNDQFAFNLFCIGQGHYHIDAVQINDSALSNYQEASYAIYSPGELVTLFPTAVFSAAEAGGQTLFAANEPEYVAPGWVGPFSANPSGTLAYRIQVDIVFPKGIYRQTKSGSLDTTAVGFEAQYQQIDDAGTPIGAWFEFTGVSEIVVSGATLTPQRRSFFMDVPDARYQLRIRRTELKTLASNFGNDIMWDGLRTYLRETQNWGNVTLLAVIIRATNNLNDQTSQKFNVIATRKLFVRESGGAPNNEESFRQFDSGILSNSRPGSAWSATPVPTRSIIWAMVDVFKSNYGGRLFDDSFFDWEALEDLDALYAIRGEFFDWTFRDPITVWEAAQTVARVGRATPLLSGSILTIKRDGPLFVPVAMFNQENILAGSFEWDIKLWDPDEYDSVRIQYTDPTTGFAQETVIATLPGGTTDHPRDVQLPGCQDRAHAFHEGMFMIASQRYLRENPSFETGLEGYIPTFGDLIAVVHDVPRWGAGGYVVSALRGSGDVYQLWLSEPMSFEETGSHVIMLRDKDSTPLGPFEVTQTEDPQQVVIHSVSDIDFLLEGRSEPVLFIFGVSANITKYLKVVSVEPSTSESVKITAVNDDPLIHSFDTLEAPALNTNSYVPTAPDLPVIDRLQITQLDAVNFIVQASWAAALGAKYYIVQTSTDGIFWRERLTTTRTSIEVQTVPGDFYVRVAGVNSGQGPWITTNTTIDYIVSLTLAGDWIALSWEISWPAVLGAVDYTVKIYDHSATLPHLKHTATGITNLRYIYDYTQAAIDSNLVRDMVVTVEPTFPPEESGGAAPAIIATALSLENTIPEAPLHPGSILTSVESLDDIYRLFWDLAMEGDLHRIKVWITAVNNFNPSTTSPELDFTAGSPGWAGLPTHLDVHIPFESHGGHSAYYWRVAVFDVWGNEIATNITAQQVIAAVP